MPDESQNQAERGTKNPIQTEPVDAGKDHRPGKPQLAKKKDDLSSYDKAKKAFLDKLWRGVPRHLRFPLVGVILLGTCLGASHSFWYPTVDAWLHPPARRIPVGGRVLKGKDQGLPNAEVELLNRDQAVVSASMTDVDGNVTFNISTADKITTLRCRDTDGSWASFSFNSKAVAEGKSFQVSLDQKRMDYNEH